MTVIHTKRLSKTLLGHYHELHAVLARTSAHKLPGAQGALREDGVSRFVATWLQKRYTVATNVFATTLSGDEYPSELDLVIHDGDKGAIWPLDGDGGNSVATWEDIRFIAQVKSTLDSDELDSACKATEGLKEFARKAKTPEPYTALFAYKVADKFLLELRERFLNATPASFPFDAFFFLDGGAYFADQLRELRIGIETGLGPGQVRNDGPAQDRLILEDCVVSKYSPGFRPVSDLSPESGLLALAALVTLSTAGEAVTQSLLAACLHGKHISIFDNPPTGD